MLKQELTAAFDEITPSEKDLANIKSRVLSSSNGAAVATLTKKSRLTAYIPLIAAALIITVGSIAAINALRRSDSFPGNEDDVFESTEESLYTDGNDDYVVDENGNIMEDAIVLSSPDEFNPNLFRKYFFGQWVSDRGWSYTIDESEKCDMPYTFFTGYIGIAGDIITTDHSIAGQVNRYWINMRNPDVMYEIEDFYPVNENESKNESKSRAMYSYTKTGEPNPPADYLSNLQIAELSAKHGFDSLLVARIVETLEDGRKIFMAANDSAEYNLGTAKRFLVSEEADKLKLSFSAELTVIPGVNDVDQVFYTIEKKDGEWVRRIDDVISNAVLPAPAPIFLFPANGGYISCEYGQGFEENSESDYPDRFHSGIDIAGAADDDIYAAEDGEVVLAEWYYDYGKCVIIKHDNGLSTLYAHCAELFVSEGDFVTRGQVIAQMGSTGQAPGKHLHFEVIGGFIKHTSEDGEIGGGHKLNPEDYLELPQG